MQLRGRLGALTERDFRLVFSSTTISAVGDGFVLVPIGSALAGPVASLVGIPATLVGSGVVSLACMAVVIAQPSVWAIGDSRETTLVIA